MGYVYESVGSDQEIVIRLTPITQSTGHTCIRLYANEWNNSLVAACGPFPTFLYFLMNGWMFVILSRYDRPTCVML